MRAPPASPIAAFMVSASESTGGTDTAKSSRKEACEARLRTMVSQAAVRPKVRKKTKPTWGSVQRRLEGKRKDAERKSSRRWKDEG